MLYKFWLQISRFFHGNGFSILWPEISNQNWGWSGFCHFTTKILVVEQKCIEQIIWRLIMSIRCFHHLSHNFHTFGENKSFVKNKNISFSPSLQLYLHFNSILLYLKRTGVSCSSFTTLYLSYITLIFSELSQETWFLKKI